MASDMVGSVMASSVAVIMVTSLLVWTRMWVRWRLGNLGLDDYTVVLSWCFLIVMCALIMTASQHGGLGRRREDISDEEYEFYLRHNAGISSTFSFGVSIAKISFALLYIRVLPQRFLVILNKILIAFLVAQAMEESLVTILKCSPVEAAYKLDVEGKCLDLRVLWWSTFVFNMSSDLILFIQPIPSVWSLQMAKAKRVGILTMMSLGLLVCVISIIRIVYVTHIGEDITYQVAEPMIWSEVEVGALLICSSIPSLRQVIAKIPWLNYAFGLSSNKTPENQYKSGANPDGSIPLQGYNRHDYLPSRSRPFRSDGSGGHYGTSTRAMATSASNNDSTEEIFPHKTDGSGAIMVTRELNHDVEYEGRSNSSVTASAKQDERIEPAGRGS